MHSIIPAFLVVLGAGVGVWASDPHYDLNADYKTAKKAERSAAETKDPIRVDDAVEHASSGECCETLGRFKKGVWSFDVVGGAFKAIGEDETVMTGGAAVNYFIIDVKCEHSW